MIGVFICKCGGNISRTVDTNKVRKAVGEIQDVSVTRVADFLCSKPGLKMIRDAITKRGLQRVVVACCSPHMHEETFRKVISEEDLNSYLLVHVNVREHCSWVHERGATEKAIDLILGGINRARSLEPLKKIEVSVCRDVLVVGGGISGITSALQLAETGYKVYLLEKKPSVGGRMAQLSKTFPTLDCSPCILSPRMADLEINPNITLITNAEIDEVSGGPGNFNVKVKVKPLGVDIEKCLKCAKCESVCPTEVPNEFEEGLYNRKAVYMPFPQAVPSAYVVDPESCTKCGACVEACPVGAINLEEGNRKVNLNVGSIILATGFDMINLEKLRSYHPEHPSCITALQMERLIETEMTEGKVLKKKDGSRVKSIAYILCAGSRDPHQGVAYCSKVCCPYAIKQAYLLKDFLPYLQIWIYYTDMRMSGRGFEQFYGEARKLGVKFIHGKPGEATPTSEGKMEILAEDIDTACLIRNQVDTLVLCPAMIASEGTNELTEKLGIPMGEDGFIASKHPKLNPISTLREGVYAAGVSLGPKDIQDSVIDARAAAA
ncbi:CoB--CoM heterodisulfide reductase iron-sulfur subunit A family protein, partial [Candidatus Bathyarchaeota archaeon]|nr:CoB--CoM heterodisulfide reductase iron-sulfur subunit A family protein [Candidatus Bathyarchaeota archaeon]